MSIGLLVRGKTSKKSMSISKSFKNSTNLNQADKYSSSRLEMTQDFQHPFSWVLEKADFCAWPQGTFCPTIQYLWLACLAVAIYFTSFLTMLFLGDLLKRRSNFAVWLDVKARFWVIRSWLRKLGSMLFQWAGAGSKRLVRWTEN